MKAILVSMGIALVGAVVWGLLYTYGWFVGLVSYFVAYLMLKMFNKYYKKECKWKYAYILGVIIVFNIIASFIALVIYCADYFDIEFGYALELLIETISSYIGQFMIEMVVGCLCAVFGVAIAIKEDKRTKLREENQAQEIESVTEEVQDKEIIKEDERPVKFCENCGTELKDGETKCPSCGADIK